MKDRIQVLDKTFVPYIPESELVEAIDKVAQKINAIYCNSGSIPVVLCVLNGAVMFTAELMKHLDFEFEFATIRLKSYAGTQSTGKVNVGAISTSLQDRDVIVCEDIVDTGKTLETLQEIMVKEGARSVKFCSMLLKPDIYCGSVPVDFVGKEIPPKFILGYGLDYNELGRGLKDIYVLAHD